MKFEQKDHFIWEAPLSLHGTDYPEYQELLKWKEESKTELLMINILVEALHIASFDNGILDYDKTHDVGTGYFVRVFAVVPEDQVAFKLRWC